MKAILMTMIILEALIHPSEKLDPRVYFLAYSLSVKVLVDEIFLEIGKTQKARNSTVTHLVFWIKMCLKNPAAGSFMKEIWRPPKDFSKNIVIGSSLSFLHKHRRLPKIWKLTTANKIIKRRPPI